MSAVTCYSKIRIRITNLGNNMAYIRLGFQPSKRELGVVILGLKNNAVDSTQVRLAKLKASSPNSLPTSTLNPCQASQLPSRP